MLINENNFAQRVFYSKMNINVIIHRYYKKLDINIIYDLSLPHESPQLIC